MTIAIFYFKTGSDGQVHTPPQPGFYTYDDKDFSCALNMVQSLRQQGMHHVVMSNEPSGMVGKFGVDTIADGKTPDGHPYEWSKQHRGAGPRKENQA